MNEKNTWDERYESADYVYGTAPNDFLVECLSGRTIGRAFSLAEGEGRNSVWMAEHGADVSAVDSSIRGVEKTHRLAATRGVTVDAGLGKLEDLNLAPATYETIVSIFAHMPSNERVLIHRKIVEALKPNGVFVLEAYTPDQLQFGTGGPKDPDMLLTAATLREELTGLEFLILREVEREVVEGTLHTGRASVVQCLAVRR